MSRGPIAAAVALGVGLLAGTWQPAVAQSIHGRVLLEGWSEPVLSARVHLLDDRLDPVTSTETDGTGVFVFQRLDPGRYYLQAEHGQAFSTIAGPVEIAASSGFTRADLILPSELFERALACLSPDRVRDHGVLAGVAYDAVTDIPIPGARVVVEWGSATGAPSRLAGEADGGGRFVLCEVPAAESLTVWAEALGRRSERERAVEVQPGAVARLDIPVYMARAASVRVLSARDDELRMDRAATVEGRLLDAVTETPIGGAEVRLPAHGLSTLTDAAGRFRFPAVPPGETTFGVQRLGYAWESAAVPVAESASMVLELRAAPQAIQLEAVVVRASTVERRMARATTQAPRVLAGAELRAAEQRTAPLIQLVRQLPSLFVREGRFETSDGLEYGMCVESSRAMHRLAVPEQKTTLPWCESIAVILDGVLASRGLETLFTLPLWEIESIEFLPPLGALQWGERAAINGALVIWTRGRGPHRDPARDGRR